ncbi:CHASE domain-containing protein [Oceanimonas doudoroffii]|uniref:Sensory/regulatory protein RpfC n=1 Tax=Oceanimonas doudoroffii TaxID=84158 RepID=A0A233RGE8_9GAMM|nr:CHASE domain-containing protein [Oceanimonas doudoroffii]OXY82477.1 hypothetical protein B6S08_02810 [Oceanimonas doudoroffii]
MPLSLSRSLISHWTLLTLIIGLCLSALATWQLHINNQRIIDDAVGDAAAQANQAVRERLSLYQFGLAGARGAVLTAGQHGISRELFRRYSRSRHIVEEFPGARGFGFIRRVPRENAATFTESARADGWPGFRIKELTPHQYEHYVIQYVEPVDRNDEAVGLDIGSELNRRTAADDAIATGQVRITGPITLVQATGNPLQSFLILMPIYEGGDTPNTLAERRAKAFGWSYAPLLMQEVLADLQLDTDAVHLALWDVTEPGREEAFYDTGSSTNSLLQTHLVKFDMFGRQWQSRFSIQPAFVQQLHLFSPLNLFFLGSFISVLVATLTGMFNLSNNSRRQVQTEQARMAAIVECSTDGIISQSMDGRITSWNQGAERIFGFRADEVLGKTTTELLVPEECRPEETAVFARVRTGKAVPHFETLRCCKNGDLINVSLTVSPLRDSSGAVVGSSKTIRNITPQKEAEAKILELNRHLEAQVTQVAQRTTELLMATEVAQLGVWRWNLADDTLTWNDRMFELYQQSMSLREHGLNYEHWLSRLHPDDVKDTTACLQAAIGGKDVFEPMFRLVLPDGQIRFIQARAQVMRNAEGTAEQLIGINFDITAQRELETSLRRSKQQADEASQAKSQFLANMSHEIRTPMNAILGMLMLVQKTRLNQQQSDYITKAQTAGRSLLGLLNDILDYSKIEAGKLQLDPVQFELDAMLRDLATVLAGNLAGKPLELMFDLDSSLPREIIADRLRLQQILINLAGNAIKFTERGEVVVKVQVRQLRKNLVRLGFSVTDSGIGIDAEKIEHIFDGFTQAEASTARRYGGSGLGLVICRRLVSLMGSKLHVQSTPGMGSRFWFDLDLGLAKGATPMPADTHTRILVVDDNEVSAGILENTLSALGYRVDCAANGEEALTEVRQHRFDLILMDWRLPDLSGLEVAKRIQERHGPVTIIMLTAYGHEELAETQNQPNPPFVDLLTKPVTTLQLNESIGRALAGQRFEPEKTLPLADEDRRLEGVRLLLVEDNAFNRQVACELLVGEGAIVTQAEDGQEGIDKVFNDTGAFDVVLMDMQMPGIDGLEATRRIRRHADCHHLPILAMTANVTVSDQQACLEAGMNAHVGKPIDLNELVRVILTLNQEQAARPASPCGENSEIESLENILRRFGNNRRLYFSMLSGFAENAGMEISALKAGLDSQDMQAVASSLHILKGMTGTMGLSHLSARFSALDRAVRKNSAQGLALLDEATLANLDQQLLQNHTALMDAVTNGEQADETDTPRAPQAESGSLHQQFESLLVLLDAGNMRAVDMVDTLAQSRPQDDPVMKELIAKVQQLNFVAARRIVSDILEEV